MAVMPGCLVALLILTLRVNGAAARKPHILFILVDDMGHGDVGWDDYPQIPTPNLQRLREEGVEMTQFYSQPKCTASRAALMTGRYPYKFGLQTNKVFSRHKNHTLDLSLKLLPAYLKDQGYATHMAGKWHLGFCAKAATPTARGFDSFFGSWENTGDHFTHSTKHYDWSWNYNGTYNTSWEAKGTYNTHLITSHTQNLLRAHFNNPNTEDTQPIFIYAAYLAPHLPAQVPEKYVLQTNCSRLPEFDVRRTYCGMVNAIDEGVGNITDTLRKLGVLDDFIIIFTSDNGGSAKAGASNWPLRGGKQTVYEGGTRVRTVLRAPKYVKNGRKKYDGLVHFVDMLPTLYVAAQGNASDLPGDLDGRDVWGSIMAGSPTGRQWMVYNIDSDRQLGAIRLKNSSHDFKLVYHNTSWCAGWKRDPRAPGDQDGRRRSYPCPKDRYRLFDLKANPEELEPDLVPDAGLDHPEVLDLMKTKLEELTREEVPPPVYVPLGNTGPGRPRNNNGAFGIGDCEYNVRQ